jgi:lipid A 3-O-deacylase
MKRAATIGAAARLFRMILRGGAAVVTALAAWPAALSAQTLALSEVKFGVLAHDIPVLATGKEHGADLNAELLLAMPFPTRWSAAVGDSFKWLLQPRPTVGGSFNTSGYTSQAYLGLTWTLPLVSGVMSTDDALYLGFTFGPSFNNGHVQSSRDDRKDLGSNVLFREGLELGYQVTPVVSVSVLFDHESNAGLARKNDGLDSLGARVGLKF